MRAELAPASWAGADEDISILNPIDRPITIRDLHQLAGRDLGALQMVGVVLAVGPPVEEAVDRIPDVFGGRRDAPTATVADMTPLAQRTGR